MHVQEVNSSPLNTQTHITEYTVSAAPNPVPPGAISETPPVSPRTPRTASKSERPPNRAYPSRTHHPPDRFSDSRHCTL